MTDQLFKLLPIPPILLPPGWRIAYRGDHPGDVYTIPAVALVACEGKDGLVWRFAELDDQELGLTVAPTAAWFGVLPPGVSAPEGVDENGGADNTLFAIREELRQRPGSPGLDHQHPTGDPGGDPGPPPRK